MSSTSPATFPQKKCLFSVTGLRIDDWTASGIEVGQAGMIIDIGFKYFGIKQLADKSIRPEFELAVRRFFPGWEVPEKTVWMGSSRKKKAGNGQRDSGQEQQREEPKPEPRPEPEPEPQEPPQAPQEPEDNGRHDRPWEQRGEPESIPENIPERLPEPEEPREAQEPEREEGKGEHDSGREQEKQEPKPDEEGYIKPSIYAEFRALVKAGINVLLSGPAGCGKSYMTERVAEDLEMEYTCISLGGGMRYAQVIGSTQIVDGDTVWKPGPLIEAIQKPGLVLLDEIFGCDPDVLLGLNSLTEPGSRKITTPGGTFKVDEGCRFVAAANTVGRTVSRQYTGAQRTDDSVLSRFAVTLPMDYDTRVEEQLLGRMGLNGERALLMGWVQSLRRKVKDANIPFDPCTRRVLAAGRAIKEAGLKPERAFEITFLSMLSAAERQRVHMDSY